MNDVKKIIIDARLEGVSLTDAQFNLPFAAGDSRPDGVSLTDARPAGVSLTDAELDALLPAMTRSLMGCHSPMLSLKLFWPAMMRSWMGFR